MDVNTPKDVIAGVNLLMVALIIDLCRTQIANWRLPCYHIIRMLSPLRQWTNEPWDLMGAPVVSDTIYSECDVRQDSSIAGIESDEDKEKGNLCLILLLK